MTLQVAVAFGVYPARFWTLATELGNVAVASLDSLQNIQ